MRREMGARRSVVRWLERGAMSQQARQSVLHVARPVGESGTPAHGPPARSPGAARLMLATLYENRSFIALSALVSLVASLVYVALSPPTWESEIVVQIEDKAKTLSGLEDLSSAFTEKSLADAEIEILRSRSLLGSVVDEVNLTIDARPQTFPVIGARVARAGGGAGAAPAVLGLRSYAWGGERLRVTRLEVPDELVGKRLELVAMPDRRFSLLGAKGELLVAGEIGKAAGAAAAERGSAEILVQELAARPGTRFTVRKRLREEVIDELRGAVRVAERGKKTGIIAVSMTGSDVGRVCATLDAIAQGYLSQNVQRRSAEAAKALDFIEQQLPRLRANVDAAETALSEFQQNKDTVSLSAETENMMKRGVEIEKALSDLDLQRTDLASRFAKGHPLLSSMDEKRAKLRAERAALASKLRNVPSKEFESARLTRDVKVASELHSLLLNKAQELRVLESGTLGNVRIIDAAARPYSPARPRPLLSCALGLLLGVAGGIGVVLVRRAVHRGIDDPELIESLTELSIYATVPHSAKQAQIDRGAAGEGAARPVLATVDPSDAAIESLRSLRTNLEFALVESRNNLIAVEGPSPGIGKSCLCANFAHVLAASGHRVLLIDGDLRRGHLHRYFGDDPTPGLSDVLAGDVTLASAVRVTIERNLYLLPSGTLRPNPAEMLASV